MRADLIEAAIKAGDAAYLAATNDETALHDAFRAVLEAADALASQEPVAWLAHTKNGAFVVYQIESNAIAATSVFDSNVTGYSPLFASPVEPVVAAKVPELLRDFTPPYRQILDCIVDSNDRKVCAALFGADYDERIRLMRQVVDMLNFATLGGSNDKG